MHAAKRRYVVLAVVLLALLVFGSGCVRSTDTEKSSSSSGAAPSAKVDYAKLLTLQDAASISGYSDAVAADSQARLGSSKYLVIYDSPNAREFLWLRVGGPSMFDEQRKVTGGAEKDTKVNGVEAYTWHGENIDSGVALRKDATTYLISTKWNMKTGALAPLVTDEQLMQAAKLVAERLQ